MPSAEPQSAFVQPLQQRWPAARGRARLQPCLSRHVQGQRHPHSCRAAPQGAHGKALPVRGPGWEGNTDQESERGGAVPEQDRSPESCAFYEPGLGPPAAPVLPARALLVTSPTSSPVGHSASVGPAALSCRVPSGSRRGRPGGRQAPLRATPQNASGERVSGAGSRRSVCGPGGDLHLLPPGAAGWASVRGLVPLGSVRLTRVRIVPDEGSGQCLN